MNNMVDYVRAYQDSFAERPLTEVDSLVLSELAYLRYETFGLAKDAARRMALWQLSLDDYKDALYKHIFSKTQLREMVEAITTSRRFRQLVVLRHVNEVDESLDKQFSATTYQLDNDMLYVAFRGTDTSMAGWKENLNMAYMQMIPSQRDAVEYLNAIANDYGGSLYVGGHSKGGNLAVFAAACCTPATQSRIAAVYDHDGPGFQREFLTLGGYRSIKQRIFRTVPEKSVVGLLLNHDAPTKVVDSKEHGVLQHSAMSWVICDNKFSTKDSVTKDAQAFAECLNSWMETLTMQERKAIVEVLIQILSASSPIALYEIFYSILRETPMDTGKLSHTVDPKDRQLLVEKVKELSKMMMETRKRLKV